MSARDAIRFTVASVDFFERPVVLRMPFRFGVVTMTEAPQLFTTVRIVLPDGRGAHGMSAFMLAPKWFDKNPALSNDDNFEQLRLAARLAGEAYGSSQRPDTGWAHHEAHYRAVLQTAAGAGLNPLVASFGLAAIDAAALDALGRAVSRSFYDLASSNLIGLRASPLVPDLAGFEFDAWLASLTPASRIAARHTVGLVDPIGGHPGQVDDGLPESLTEVIRTYGHRHFKLKVGGRLDEDLERLGEIARVLDHIPDDYLVSLDGNEQYEHVDQVVELWDRLERMKGLQRLSAAIRFIEQPIMRKHALSASVQSLARHRPVIIDESDGSFDAFEKARALGYRGVSSKLCKGVYRSIINAARCSQLNELARRDGQVADYLMSGEDLTNQAGLAVQQDLALANLIGITHVERNGHHYVKGMAGAPAAEQQAFAAAHPDLYAVDDAVARLRINDGQLSIGSLACNGFASAVHPDGG